MLNLSGYILTGGAGLRIGGQKANVPLADVPLGQRTAAVMRQVVSGVFAVGADMAGMPTIPEDPHEQRAAIFGAAAALDHSQTEWTMIMACDLPFVTASILSDLLNCLDPDVDAVVPIQLDGRPQPLCSIYRTDVCRMVVHDLIAGNELKLQEILARVRTRCVSSETLGAGACTFFNLNTQADLDRAEEIIKEKAREGLGRSRLG